MTVYRQWRRGLRAILRRGRPSGDLLEIPISAPTLLDQFSPPTFVKIDVEGAEVMVLRGASKLLRNVKPTLYVEVGSENFDAVTQLLHSFEYSLNDSTKPLRNQTALTCCVHDTLAVPQKN
jgi:hypothetical protein